MCLSLESVPLPWAGVLARYRDGVISFPSLSKTFLIYISVVYPNYHPFGFLFHIKLPFPAYDLLRMLR